MEQVPRETSAAFERRLEQAGVPLSLRAAHHKWVRFYLDFCHKYRHPPDAPTSLGPFLAKLASKNQSPDQRHQASVAVRLLTEAGPAKDRSLQVAAANPVAGEATPGTGQSSSARSRPVAQPPRPKPVERMTPQSAAAPWRSVTTARSSGQGRPAAPLPRLEGERSGSHGSAAEQAAANASGASWEQEYRDLEGAIRLRNYSSKTLEAYRLWVVKFQAFVRSRPTGQLSGQEVRGFLTDLAVRHGVAASTQNQAFNALLFFYRHVLGREFGKLEGVVRAKRRPYVPVVLSRSEMDAVLSQLPPPHRLVGLLLYGCGLRLAECLGLRIHCFNLDAMLLTVHDGNGCIGICQAAQGQNANNQQRPENYGDTKCYISEQRARQRKCTDCRRKVVFSKQGSYKDGKAPTLGPDGTVPNDSVSANSDETFNYVTIGQLRQEEWYIWANNGVNPSWPAQVIAVSKTPCDSSHYLDKIWCATCIK